MLCAVYCTYCVWIQNFFLFIHVFIEFVYKKQTRNFSFIGNGIYWCCFLRVYSLVWCGVSIVLSQLQAISLFILLDCWWYFVKFVILLLLALHNIALAVQSSYKHWHIDTVLFSYVLHVHISVVRYRYYVCIIPFSIDAPMHFNGFFFLILFGCASISQLKEKQKKLRKSAYNATSTNISPPFLFTRNWKESSYVLPPFEMLWIPFRLLVLLLFWVYSEFYALHASKTKTKPL